MNPQSFVEAKRLFDATKKLGAKYRKAEIIIMPPAVFLRDLAKSYRGTAIEMGVQNVFWEREGSYTGEISPAQARDAGAAHVIIGHAERRGRGETDDMVRRKVVAVLQEKMYPIIAVGENDHDTQGEYIHTVREQIITALEDVPAARFKDITIAYEPVWAIGAEQAPDANAVHQMVLLVRKTLLDTYGEKAMKAVRVVYGGAVNGETAAEILAVPGLSGVLVGRASLSAETLQPIIDAAHNA